MLWEHKIVSSNLTIQTSKGDSSCSRVNSFSGDPDKTKVTTGCIKARPLTKAVTFQFMNGLVNLQRIGWEASTSTNSVSRACPFRHRDFELRCHHAQVAKLAHADALGASAARLAGSNPVLSTIGDRSPPCTLPARQRAER